MTVAVGADGIPEVIREVSTDGDQEGVRATVSGITVAAKVTAMKKELIDMVAMVVDVGFKLLV